MAGSLYILGLLLLLPALAWRMAWKLDTGRLALPARSSVHVNALIVLGVLLAAALTVARLEKVMLFPAGGAGWLDGAAVAGFLAITLGGLALLLRLGAPVRRRRLERITMSNWRDPRQLVPYAAVCVMAGLAEEVAYRGLLVELLERRTGSTGAAVAIASLAFGATHAVQGWTGVLLATLLALLFHAMVALTGDLYAAIVAHAAYDLIAGIVVSESAARRRKRRRAGRLARDGPRDPTG